MSGTVTPARLKELLDGEEELALLDVREEGVFALSHIFHATSLALSWLELRVRTLAPRLGAPVVLTDDGEGLAQRAADKLESFGYKNVSVLAGGNPGWKADGHILYSGVNVPGKAFGEFVEHKYSTPSVSAEELRDLLKGSRDLVILDSRPMEEYNRMNIPGGVNVPGAELVYRINDIAPSKDTLVVVNCAGRTRSIIGAQSLINAGVPNEVVALRNGTMGWHLSGLTLETGKRRGPPEPTSKGVVWARDAAERVKQRFGVRTIGLETLQQWQAEQGERTLYLMDVRTPQEFEAGHMAGARSAPGGQLVQGADAYLATRGARVVLLDHQEVRAAMTASWLVQMGWSDAVVLEGGMLPYGQESGSAPEDIPGLEETEAHTVTPAELAEKLKGNEETLPAVIDLSTSDAYRKGHIPAAIFAIRARFAEDLKEVPSGPVVLTSSDGVLATLAAPELEALRGGGVSVLEGGNMVWAREGHPLAEGPENMASKAEDVFPKPYDRPEGVEQAMRDYLEWEVNLVAQIDEDGDASYRFYPPL